jgi:hypothetical protein
MQLTLPSTPDDLKNYKDNFERAIAFSNSCGFALEQPAWLNSEVLNESGDFLEPVFKAAGVHDVTKSASQCLKWSHFLAPWFEKQLKCKVWPTLGQVWQGEKQVFNPTWDDFKRWGKVGIQRTDLDGRMGFNLHAWLTLESGEIIDLTFMSTLAQVIPDVWGKYDGAVVFGQNNKILNNQYLPMAVGMQFAESIGTKSVVPLIANNPKELHEYIIGYVRN